MTPEKIEEALTTLALSMVELRADVDRIATTLRDAVKSLIVADDSLSFGIEELQSRTSSMAHRITNLEDDVYEPSASQPVIPIPTRPTYSSRAVQWLFGPH